VRVPMVRSMSAKAAMPAAMASGPARSPGQTEDQDRGRGATVGAVGGGGARTCDPICTGSVRCGRTWRGPGRTASTISSLPPPARSPLVPSLGMRR
jgi:hypothetical protein